MSAFPFQLGCSPAILFWTRNETRYRRRRRRRYLDFSVVYRLTTLTRVTQTCCGPLVGRNYVLQGGRVSFDWRTTQPLKPVFMHDMIGRAAGSLSCMLFLCWIQVIHLIGYETNVKKMNRATLNGLHARRSQSEKFCGGSQEVGEKPLFLSHLSRPPCNSLLLTLRSSPPWPLLLPTLSRSVTASRMI